jgi:hypothetical protein
MQDSSIDQSGVAATGADTNQTDVSQAQAKTFTQDEVNKIIAARLAQAEKKYAGVDVEEYKALKTVKQQQEEAEAIKRSEFEKVLKQTREQADNEIRKYRSEIETIKIDGALINAAAKNKAVNPEHIAKLLKAQTRLTEDGNVEVLDDKGQVRYNTQTANPYQVEDLVQEFIAANPYFRAATPAGSGSKSNTAPESAVQALDITKLDMSNPKDRAKYREFRRSQGII